mmetsp:Transcript_61933/g.134185  ORF Transcript_61933/g.134185 Transcript_61933/m.134185 type:complete len:238 (+) Transcript_61933:2279-2992(+)
MRCLVARRRSAHSEEPASVRCDCDGGMAAASSAVGAKAQPKRESTCSTLPHCCLPTISFFLFLHTNLASKGGIQNSSSKGDSTRAAAYPLLERSTRINFEKRELLMSLRCRPRRGRSSSARKRGGSSASSAAALRSSFRSLAGTGLSRSTPNARTLSATGAARRSESAVVSNASWKGAMPVHVEGTTPPSSDRRQPFAKNWRASSRPSEGLSLAKRAASCSRYVPTLSRLSFSVGGC